MQTIPNMVSPIRMSCILLKRLAIIWGNVVPPPCIPSISLSCDEIINKATAEVKPDDTGPDMKSIMIPAS